MPVQIVFMQVAEQGDEQGEINESLPLHEAPDSHLVGGRRRSPSLPALVVPGGADSRLSSVCLSVCDCNNDYVCRRRRRTTWECDASDLLMENKEMRRTREVAVEERGGRMVWLPASQSLETKSPEPLSRLSTCAARAIALERMLGIREETGSTIRVRMLLLVELNIGLLQVVASLRRDV